MYPDSNTTKVVFLSKWNAEKRLKTTPTVKRRHHYTDSVFEWVANKLARKVFPVKEQPPRLKHTTTRKKHALTKRQPIVYLIRCVIYRRKTCLQ